MLFKTYIRIKYKKSTLKEYTLKESTIRDNTLKKNVLSWEEGIYNSGVGIINQ
jgi:hypothetical protein